MGLLRDPDVTVSSVAMRQGVIQVTLYAHLNAPAKRDAHRRRGARRINSEIETSWINVVRGASQVKCRISCNLKQANA